MYGFMNEHVYVLNCNGSADPNPSIDIDVMQTTPIYNAMMSDRPRWMDWLCAGDKNRSL